MKVVIELDSVDYMYIKNGCIVPIKIDNHIYDAIRSGTVLPKGHGDLVDRDALLTDDNISDLNDGYGSAGYFRYVSVNTIKESPTVIPADKKIENE